MVDLPKKKVGLVACSGEEMAEGTVTRLAVLRVLEQLRPADTVTICLPLFLAGGEGDRTFARFYPTIALDGCSKRCAARGTEKYSGKPAASIVVADVVTGDGLGSARRLNAAGRQAVDTVAALVAQTVDELLGGKPQTSEVVRTSGLPETSEVSATCSCGSGVPVLRVQVNGREVELIALPAVFETFRAEGRPANEMTAAALLEQVKVYNRVPSEEEAALREAVSRAYAAFVAEKGF